MKKKSSKLDPIPTSNGCESVKALIPKIINLSVSTGCFLSQLKNATITPIIRGESLDCDDLKNYRPVSNLPFLSKIIGEVVAEQLISHLSSINLLSKSRSGYKKIHSCETALISVVNDIQTIISQKNLQSSWL